MTTNVSRKRPPIRIGRKYEFYSTMQQEYEPPEERIRNYTGQRVTVLSCCFKPGDNGWEPGVSERAYMVRADDGFEFYACKDELDGWIKDTGQYFWPDATYGPDHDRTFLSNERTQEKGKNAENRAGPRSERGHAGAGA